LRLSGLFFLIRDWLACVWSVFGQGAFGTLFIVASGFALRGFGGRRRSVWLGQQVEQSLREIVLFCVASRRLLLWRAGRTFGCRR
jgi:hypothetical protein